MDSPRPLITVGSFVTTPRMRELVGEVLDSGRISYGDKSRKFEKEFASLHNSSYGILSNSGTSSLHVALQTLKEIHGWEDGDSVAIPAVTFVATANVVLHNRLTPILIDVETNTFGMNPFDIEQRIDSHTRAIIPVHMLGQPCEMADIASVARHYNLRSIEDSCEAMFVTHCGSQVGSMSDIGCFSMYVAHLLVTGVGGISITDNPEYAAHMRSLVNHGLSIDNLNVDDNFSPRPMLNRKFVFDYRGHSSRITEFEAALGLAGLEDWERMNSLRQRNAKLLLDGLAIVNDKYGFPLTLPQVVVGNTHSWMMFGLMTNREHKDGLTHWLNEHSIETRDVPTLFQPCYNWNPDDYPVAKRVMEDAFYVGCHPEISENDCEYMIEVIGDYFDRGH